MTFDEYLQQPEARRVLLVEIQRRDAVQTRYYLSDDFYITEPSDTPANLDYSPIIGGRGLPGLRRILNDIFTGNASTGFGTLELTNDVATYTDTMGRGEATLTIPKGASVSVQVVAPRSEFPRNQFLNLLVGKTARTGFTSDGFFSVELVDGSDELAAMELEVEAFPLAFGYCFNVLPFLIDPAARRYAVHDGAIEAITAVYDDGVMLAPAQYTVNLSTGQFTLANAPQGVVTADVKGDKTGGVYASSTQQVIDRILTRLGVTVPRTFAPTIPTGEIGYFVESTQTLGQTLNDLTQAFAGYWLLDRLGVLEFAQYPIPTGVPSIIFTEQEIIGEIESTQADELFNSVRYQYRRNYTPNQSVRPGASAAQADFARREAFEGQAVAGGLNPEFVYTPSPLLVTFFVNQGDAQTVANRILDLHKVPRNRMSLSVPFTETLEIGSLIEIEFFGQTYQASVTGVTDVFDGTYPVQEIEVIA